MRQMPELEVVKVPTIELVEYRSNAKLHPIEQIDQIAQSIWEFGFNNPILAWRNDEGEPEIVAGHGRLMAARKLGLRELPVVFLDHMTEEQRRAYILVDNQLTMNSGFDDEILSMELQNIFDIDMSQFDFDIELDDDEFEESEGEVEEDEVPEDVPSIVQKGDVWQLGRHRLMCGDSTDSESVAKLMDDNIADLCFTSPPYNAMAGFHSNDGIGNPYMKTGGVYESYTDNLSSDDYARFLTDALNCALDHCDDVLFNIGYTKGALSGTAAFLGMNCDKFGGALSWEKSNAFIPQFDVQKGVLTNVCEPVYYFNSEGRRKFKHHQWKDWMPNEVKTESASGNEFAKKHGATFPVSFASEIVGNFTDNSVLDLFGGTGTTLIAAEQLGRTCYMMELDPHYCDIIIERWQNLTGETARKVETDGQAD